MKTSIVALLLSISASFAQAPSAEQLVPLSQAQFSQVDAIVQKAMKTALIPGAALIIGHEGEVVYRQAYGSRALVPRRETMTLDTIFDAASLIKVVATTPCVMKLFEQGKVRLDDPVTKYLPEFKGGQSDITVRSVMTHFLGMPPDLSLKPRWIMGAGVHRVVNRDVKTLAGIDVLEEDGFAELKGKRIGLVTNQTGFDRAGRRDVDAMLAAGVQVVSLFSPEHGFSVSQDTENIPDTKDSSTGLPIVSLYEPGKRRLTAEQMGNLDAVVYDIQDVGTRFWTYSCTLLYAVEESGKAKKPFFVLDRPNPITGTHVEGPMLDNDLHSFTGCYEMPLRHGMTFGELATMANAEQHWGADLRVIKLKNWERGDWFDATTLTWVNPSPNMRSLNAALLYPGVGMIEHARNYSVGRGTDAPFEQIGADWIDGPALAQLLNSRFIPGVRVYPTRFRPSSSNLKDVDVSGVRFVITDRDAFDSTRLGIELAAALQKLFPGKIDFEKCRLLIGNHAVLNELKNGTDASAIWSKAQEQASQFAERRKPYLLY